MQIKKYKTQLHVKSTYKKISGIIPMNFSYENYSCPTASHQHSSTDHHEQ